MPGSEDMAGEHSDTAIEPGSSQADESRRNPRKQTWKPRNRHWLSFAIDCKGQVVSYVDHGRNQLYFIKSKTNKLRTVKKKRTLLIKLWHSAFLLLIAGHILISEMLKCEKCVSENQKKFKNISLGRTFFPASSCVYLRGLFRGLWGQTHKATGMQ